MPELDDPPAVDLRPAAIGDDFIVAIVDVDNETGRLKIEQYVVVHDCGVVVNPMLVEGQVMGGTAQIQRNLVAQRILGLPS